METTSYFSEQEEFRKHKAYQTGGNGRFGHDVTLNIPNIADILKEEEEEEGRRKQKTLPENLYRTNAQSNEVIEISNILKVRAKISEIIRHVEDALECDDEIERESIMNIVAQGTFDLNRFLNINKNFRNAVCLIQTVNEAHLCGVFTREQIYELKKVLILVKDNIFMDIKTLDRCVDILENAKLDINAPLLEIDLF